MKILIIIGTDNGWAIANRGNYLARELRILGQEVLVIGRHDLPAAAPECDVIHIQTQVMIRRLAGRFGLSGYLDHPCWGFEVISQRSLDSLAEVRQFLPRAKFCVAKNPALAAKMIGLACRVDYVPNGIDPEVFAPRILRVGWVGNSRKEDTKHNQEFKGVPLIEAAVAQLRNRWGRSVAIEFAVCPGSYPRYVLPHRSMADWYRSLDVMVSASESEGCSNTVNEALACGVPVVSTHTGIAAELARKCDVQVVERSIEGIITGIRHFIEPVVLRRQALERLSWARLADQYIRVYRRALQ